MTMISDKYHCPCCQHLTLTEPPPGSYLICSVCGWEDDPIQFDDENYQGGANRVSLRQARDNYLECGCSDPEY